jgi:hypothetical protein
MIDTQLKKDIAAARGRIPIFIAEEMAGKQIRIWCPYCVNYHIHSAVTNGMSFEGHRIAKCNTESPYKKTGYYLISQLRANRLK